MNVHVLFESRSDMARLREEIAGPKARMWSELLPEIEKHCAEPYRHVGDFTQDTYVLTPKIASNLAAGLHGAFGYLVTGERRFFECARDHLMPMLSWERWSIPFACTDGRWFDLRSAEAVRTFAFYLDWCGDAISEEERRHIVLALENFGARCVIHDHEVKVGWYDEQGSMNNWVAVMNGSMGLAALLLWREKPIFREALGVCLRHARRFLDWVHDDGATDEAGGYWRYGMTHLLLFLEALRVNRDRVPPEVRETGACDWLAGSEKLSRTAMFPLLGVMGGEFAMLFGDCDPDALSHFMEPCALLARTFRDEQVQWYVQQMKCTDPLALLWYDPSLKATAPGPDLIARIFDTDWLLVRDSPAIEDGFFFALRGGHNAQTHGHCDLGTFILWHGGQPLIADPGREPYTEAYWHDSGAYYRKNSFGHNVVIVDGVGQVYGAETNGKITGLSDDGPVKTYRLDMVSPNNGILRQRRTLEFDLRDEPVITLTDDLQTRTESSVAFLFHHCGQARIEGHSAWITRPGAELRLDFESVVPLTLAAVEHEEMDYVSATPRTRAAQHELRVVMICHRIARA
jgi:hypothetical protein